jgi:hypothetical protein
MQARSFDTLLEIIPWPVIIVDEDGPVFEQALAGKQGSERRI